LPRSVGAYITDVMPGGPQQAGLRRQQHNGSARYVAGGDLIIAIDERPVSNFADLLSYLINYKNPGDRNLFNHSAG
jgi:S1-C subfamily serine protease